MQVKLDAGWTAWLVTLTLRHGRGDRLEDLFAALRGAWSRVTSGKRWDAIRKVGAPEYVRGLDLTWSDLHGWHPHLHVVLLLPPAHGDGRAVADGLALRWREGLSRAGFQALAGAQDVQPCRDAGAAAAYATAPAAVYEAVGIGGKTARSPRAGATAFDLLKAAVPLSGAPGHPAAVARWCEYVAAVKGRRQTTVSRGLTLSDDEDLLDAEEEGVAPDVVAMIGPDTVAELDRGRRVPELLEAVEYAAAHGSRESMRLAALGVLITLAASDWGLVHPPSERARSAPVALCADRVPVPYEPPELWVSPITADGRIWRRVTREDRGILARMAIRLAYPPVPCSTGSGVPPPLSN